MPNNQMQGDGWNDLLGLYTGVLQNDSSSGRTQMSNRSNEGVASANNDSRMQRSSSAVGVVGVKAGLQGCLDVVPVDVYNRLPPNFNPNGLKGVNLLEQSNQKVASRTLPNCGNLDQNFGTSRRNLGEINLPRKVDSMAELMSSASTIQAPLLMGTPNKGTYNTSRLGGVGPQPVASIQMMCTPSHTQLHQNHTPLVEHNNGNYNLQELSSGRLSVPYCQSYNLNLPPRLESGESSIAARQFSFGPVTPAQLKQSKNCQIIEISDSLTDETYCTDMYKLDNAALSPQPVRLEREQNKSLLNSLDALPQQSEILPCEKNNSDVGNGGIDLNKTPQQKTPKRRKIRPKVVIEGKPRRTPKPVDTKSSPADNKPKRKYVRKNGNQTSTPQSIDVIEIAESSGTRPAQKSCKRALNFDLDSGAENKSQSRKFDHQTQNNGGTNHSFNLNLDSNNADWSARLDRPSTSFVNHGSQDTFSKETQQMQNTHNIVQFNEVPSQEPMPLVTTAPPAFKNHTLNVIARILNARKTGMSVSGVNDGRSHVHQHFRGSLTKLVTQSNSIQSSLQNKRPMLKTVPKLPWDLEYVSEQGSKREYTQTETIQPKTSNLMGCQLWSHAVFEMGHCDSDSRKLLQNSQEKSKMKMIGDKFYGATSCSHSGFTVNEGSSGLMGSIRNKTFSAQNSLKQQNGELRFTGGKGKSVSKILDDKLDAVNGDWFINYQDLRHEFQQQNALSELQLGPEQMAKKASYLANEQNTNFLTPVIGNPVSASGSGCNSVLKNVTIKSTDPVTVKKRPVGRPKKVPVAEKNGTGSKIEHKTSLFINNISDRMKYLSINDNGKAIILKEQTALVPYKADGTIIPFEEFDPMKKKRPRPRVDLDPETNRLWNLLMGNEGSENAETMDSGKQKFWENERHVFRGRVDSFIARMHLVQGDRRFSKWKGSVVDSVIGVFLTQNVSDHLSSSAFMSLVAKFPLKSGSSSLSQNYEEVHVAFPDGTTSDFKMIKEPTSANSSVMYPESSVCRAESEAKGKSPLFINDQTKKSEEDIISSQSSSESIVFQASEDIRSSSGSNSEAEDGWNFGKNFGNPTISEQPERIATLQQSPFPVMVDSMPSKGSIIGHQVLENPVYRQSQVLSSSSNECSYPVIPDVAYHEYPILQSISTSSTNTLTSLEKWEVDILAFSGKESVSSLASAITNGEEIFAHECVGQNSGIRFTRSPNETPQFQPSLRHDAILREHRELQTDIPDGTLRINGLRKQGTFQLDSASLVDPKNSAEASIRQGNDNWKQTAATPLAKKEQEKKSGSTNSPMLNARKRKAEKEPFDWDSLRKEAQSRAGTRGRSWVTLDSIDYEVLRNANVREISDTIKERGMNNLLAERMKDFLNRLVRDHGKVDLEWLRDVAPDKAKEYLLSIRGLGLKSVECVRLLTLHHLAFPVDTNVGRIAVRLGWVPLQPLPESLQLHLLELYPVLESIQKYLWPRLCKLDQETLYELHYQMITFGKVFCTKREPNCNACPMRAECRHFASAFASARLSLPAPEEKQVVSSAVPICTARNPDAQVKPLSMLLSEENVKETQLARDAGPLIEEPASPEPPTELLERDIEDAFYEDPDEIPVIKLNVKEFTTNLQNIMQEKLEFGEGDMSRALVALSPEFASIPVPKLKHVSRLRTEHQVYELPDSHPLLTGMDLREPDDPSPYLLAIWTPGETADSVQPPDRNCSTQEGGGLCINSTCFSCSSAREAQAQTVRGTILIPCRTAMRGSFPLNGTYFQVNEVFADHESSLDPIDVPRSLIWNLSRRTVFFGTSVSSIFKGLSTEGIQYCFWKGFVCVRGFDRKTRAPRPLKARLHLPASKMNEAEREKKLGAKLHVGNANQNPAL